MTIRAKGAALITFKVKTKDYSISVTNFGPTVTLCHADQSLPRSNSDTASREFGSGVEKLLPKEGIAGVVLKLFHPPMSNLRPSLRRTGQKIGLGWNVCYISRILNLKRLG